MVTSTSVIARPHRPLAVVTGAASGIGHTRVRALLGRDLDVVAIGLTTDAIRHCTIEGGGDPFSDFGAPAIAKGIA